MRALVLALLLTGCATKTLAVVPVNPLTPQDLTAYAASWLDQDCTLHLPVAKGFKTGVAARQKADEFLASLGSSLLQGSQSLEVRRTPDGRYAGVLAYVLCNPAQSTNRGK